MLVWTRGTLPPELPSPHRARLRMLGMLRLVLHTILTILNPRRTPLSLEHRCIMEVKRLILVLDLLALLQFMSPID